MTCLKAADKDFRSQDLVISEGVKNCLNEFQKVYLLTCFSIVI